MEGLILRRQTCPGFSAAPHLAEHDMQALQILGTDALHGLLDQGAFQCPADVEHLLDLTQGATQTEGQVVQQRCE